METASQELMSARCTDHLMGMLGGSMEDILAENQASMHWCKLLALRHGASDMDFEIVDYHMKIATRMTTHLLLTFEHLQQPEWLCAALLSTRPHIAQEAASALHEHLKRKAANELNEFEHAVREDGALWAELGLFCDRSPPVRLWRGNGAFATLFRFAAARYLGNADSALGAEGIHARWQDIIRKRMAVKHPLPNALSKLQSALRDGGGCQARTRSCRASRAAGRTRNRRIRVQKCKQWRQSCGGSTCSWSDSTCRPMTWCC